MRVCTTLLFAVLLAASACSGDGKDQGDPSPEACRNGIDDDLDGRVDCQDSDCFGNCAEICDNGVDDDDDSLIDCADPGCDGQCPEDCTDGRDNDLDGRPDCLDSDCAGICPEDCANGVDDDSDGLEDCDDDDCASTCDGDDDGAVAIELGGADCDDADPDRYPGAPERCNGIDDDCDLQIDDDDDDTVDATDWYVDADQDGWGNSLQKLVRCAQPSETVETFGDCNDANADQNPDAQEICNGGIDDDCDGLLDDSDPSLDTSTLLEWYVDADNDGWGVPSSPIVQCAQPPNRADNTLDCDDGNFTIGREQTWLLDDDGDGVGAGTPSALVCSPPGADWVPESNGLDCNDAAPLISPGAEEICDDGIDQDCDGSDFTGCNDTAAWGSIHGDATVNTVAATYTGAEVYQYTGVSSGFLVCEWTWTSLDWAHDATAPGIDPFAGYPCDDPDGYPCDWAYTVHNSAGAMTGGTDCAFYGLTPATATLGGTFGYGWTDAYRAGGTNFGETMMYFYPPAGFWLSLNQTALFTQTSDYDPPSGAFSYDWTEVQLFPTP